MKNQEALNWLRAQFADFSFESPADEARFIVYLATTVTRPDTNYSPFFLFTSEYHGSGCSLAAGVGRLLVRPDGRFIAIGGGKRHEKEDLLALSAAACCNVQFLHCNEAAEAFESPFVQLAVASADGENQVRTLGANEPIPISGLVITASGVNSQTTGFLASRTVTINLTRAADLEAAARRPYTHPNLHGWVRTHRAELVMAINVLTSGMGPAATLTYGLPGDWAETVLNPLSQVFIDGVNVRELAMGRQARPETKSSNEERADHAA
jgi:hypothetical protein